MADSTANDSAKPADKVPSNPAARTNLLLMVIILVLALLFVGGGVAAFMIVRSGNHTVAAAEPRSEDAAPEEGQAAKAAKPKESDSKKPKKDKDAPKAAAIYVTLEPPFVVNFPAGKPAKFLQITMEIMTRDAATAQVLKENNPLLRNDLLMLFGNQQYEVIAAPEGKEALRAQAVEAVRGVAKKEGGKPGEVEAVYFTSFVMQ